MAETVLHIWGGGDSSVGISATDATITIVDDFIEHDKDQIKDLKEFFNEFYDNGRIHIMTDTEYQDYRSAEMEAWNNEQDYADMIQ